MKFDQAKKYLLGNWKGKGFSQYPTIQDAPYLEEFVVTDFDEVNVLKFEQKAWYTTDSGEKENVVFWETGFWVFKENSIQLLSSQFSGRFELLTLQHFEAENNEFHFRFESASIVNDPRVIRSVRNYALSAESLTYNLEMELSSNRVLENHLSAELLKV